MNDEIRLASIAEKLGLNAEDVIYDEELGEETLNYNGIEIFYSIDYNPDYIEVATDEDQTANLPDKCIVGQDITNICIPVDMSDDEIIKIINNL